MAIVGLFILLLPFLVRQIASDYTNFSLQNQKKKVLQNIKKNGLDYYFQGDDNYGSYTMLKEEYISLETTTSNLRIDTIKTTQRIVEQDTLTYRVLSFTFKTGNKNYLLEIGKTTASINLYNDSLQRFALYVLVILIALSIIIDLIFTRQLIRPLSHIIKLRLSSTKFPFKKNQTRIKTSTTDFRYLDDSLISLMNQINEAFDKEREFTANASHEFMTPISILQNKMENLLSEESTTESDQRHIVDMMRTLERLKKISRSLLLISRIENEQFIKQETVEPSKLFAEIQEEIEHRLEEKNIKININLQKNHLLQQVNYDLLFQLFYNLVNNAIKFNSKNGNIVISDDIKNNKYIIQVEDNGIGIAEHQLPFIFDRFKKFESTQTSGHGLGLAIVKSIIIYLNLEIEVKSKPGTGTKFEIIFKL
ncbi:sensor histidine kinase [Pedobacter punctiformis]|uniref:histidine kinase n=1 Tax=Pedobacter punctiformis TaxID=3004097 RepID=A0ABT4L8L1_9SPHI|nr:HAMP domain-containing sensor histidine kinase [Pedobacter sp. HCMS5-2]MCZ4244253.1 HAMP domain-containing sensor histidine kinase [Pedobacter sp. HCMS5-2]